MAQVGGRQIRSAERRSSTLAVTTCILVGVFLVAGWMFAAPTNSQPASSSLAGGESGSRSSLLRSYDKAAFSDAKIGGRIFKKTAEINSNSRIFGKNAEDDSSSDAEDTMSLSDTDPDTAESKINNEETQTAESIEPKGSDRVEEIGDQAELNVENKESLGSLNTQAKESREERKVNSNATPSESEKIDEEELEEFQQAESTSSYNWKLCSAAAGADYIPCLDNVNAVKRLKSTKHYEHRERHCPSEDDSRLCLVPLPDGYKPRIPWPRSRNEIWYDNVPHTGLVSYKADQKWVTRKDDLLVFPGGGTQFKKGATRYIDFVEKTLPAVAWGKHTRVILDVGCGVASFGGYQFDKDVLTMSFAPKDEHEAQVQFALERGIPAISAVMGTTRLPFPSSVYDAVHCARCRVPWHLEGAKLLLELNRVLRPGGYFMWSATPVYQREPEDVEIWKATTAAARKLCWKRLARTKDPQTGIGVAIFQKPLDNTCLSSRKEDDPPICEDDVSPDAAWYTRLGDCVHKIDESRVTWPEEWPSRLEAAPKLLDGEAAEDFASDTKRWKDVFHKNYAKGLGIDWDSIRNVMDMRAGYGGFAAALASLPVWVMNVVPVNESDKLPIIFDRGLFGMYHDWCESFSTYPRTYDLLHADNLFSQLGESCNATYVLLEMDRILRPEGWVIIRDTTDTLKEIRPIIKSLHWEVKVSQDQFLAAQKKMWRPKASI